MSSLESKQKAFHWVVLMRWISIFILVLIVLGLEKRMPDRLVGGVWAILLAASLYNLVFHLLSLNQRLVAPLTLVGFVIDGLLISWAVSITGGPLSAYIPFYLCVIITACFLVPPRMAVATAVLQLLLFLGTLWFCYESHVPSDFAPRNSNLFYAYMESTPPEVREGIYVEQAVRWSFFLFLTTLIGVSLVRHVWSREERLRSKERELEQKRHLIQMGELTGRIAHGVNTPLGLISGNLEMLIGDTRKGSKTYKNLSQIEQYVQRAIRTVRDILDFSRQTLSEIKPTSLPQVVQSVVAAVQPKLKKTGGKLILDLEPNLPLITAYPEGLFQVLLNLVENAVDSIHPGGLITLSAHFHYKTMRLSAEDRRGDIKVVVRDMGKGIPPEEIKRIFEPFYSTKGFGKGTGLGLAIVKRIVDEHHGHIKVESKLGEGTTFTLVFPTDGAAPERSIKEDNFDYNKSEPSLKGPLNGKDNPKKTKSRR